MRKRIQGLPSVEMTFFKRGENTCGTEDENEGLLSYMHYKEKFSHQERRVYEQLQIGMLNCDRKIEGLHVDARRCEAIFNAILLDTPMIFHVDGCKLMEIGKQVSVVPNYYLSKTAYTHNKKDFMNELQKLLYFIRKEKSEWDRMILLHSFLIKQIRYKDVGIKSHSAVAPLVEHIGVCDGVSKMVKAVCDALGMKCAVITGKAKESNGVIGNHAWNAIKIDGEWSCFDFTFDITLNQNNPCSAIQCMDYFSLDYGAMSKDHFEWSVSFDKGEKKKDYFTRNGLVVKKQSDIERLLIGKKNERFIEIAFRVSDNWKDFDIKNVLGNVIDYILKRENRSYRYFYTFNDRQRIGYVHIE